MAQGDIIGRFSTADAIRTSPVKQGSLGAALAAAASKQKGATS